MSDTAPKINAPKQSDGPRPIKALGRNQQVSVASLIAIFLGLAALFLGFSPLTNTYSLLPAGLALLLSFRATLYAWTGTVYARGLPVVALAISALAMAFCCVWPYYGDDVLDRYDAWRNPPEADPNAPDAGATPDRSCSPTVSETQRKADEEIQRQIKKQIAIRN